MKQQIEIKSAAVIGTTVALECAPADCDKVRALMDEHKPLAALIGTVEKKRSLSANAYAWVLMNQLAEKLNTPALDIYRNLIRDVGGSSFFVTLRADAAEAIARGWMRKGDGWQVSKLDEMVTPEGVYHTLQLWRGSSDFNASEMHRLIELIVQECKQQGIPTMTPEEISRLRGLVEDA